MFFYWVYFSKPRWLFHVNYSAQCSLLDYYFWLFTGSRLSKYHYPAPNSFLKVGENVSCFSHLLKLSRQNKIATFLAFLSAKYIWNPWSILFQPFNVLLMAFAILFKTCSACCELCSAYSVGVGR